tara:strand:+ start:1562 stop:2524 length:963 start_codon:yes stop_codon:yes gene_type:complete
METTQTIKSEEEKMVPIDTSGNAVDVELKEESKEESNVKPVKEDTEATIKVVEEEKETPAQEETSESELEEYSAGVKKRIDKLTKKMREAERREAAAIEYAKKAKEELDKSRSSSINQNEAYLGEREKSLATQNEFAKRALEAAIQANDVEKQVAANQEIARLTIEAERLKLSKAKAANKKAEMEAAPQENVEQKVNETVASQPENQPDAKAEAWAQKNEWFGNDNAMTYTAYDIHQQLVKEGVDPRTDEYYIEIDKRIRKEFPHKFSDGGEARPKQKVASVVRNSSTGRRTVRLTPSQVAIAKKLGVPLEEYAKHVKEA